MIERSEIRFGSTLIPFQIRRSERRATVALAIDAGRLVVTAPHNVAVERLNAVVRGKAFWVKQRLREESAPTEHAREFVSGETFRYLGRQYRLQLQRSDEPEVKLDRGWLVVSAKNPTDATRAEVVRGLLVGWYWHRAEERLPEWVDRWARKLRLAAPPVLIRDQRRRWGSCSRAGEIRLNWRLMQAPPSLVDYVAAHELVHLALGDEGHGREFWARLGRAMPDYDARRESLRVMGPVLEW